MAIRVSMGHEHYDNDDFGHALAAFARTKLDVNGVGRIVDIENRRSTLAILLHDPVRSATKIDKDRTCRATGRRATRYR